VSYDETTKQTTVGVAEGEVKVFPANDTLQPATLTAQQQIKVTNNNISQITAYTGDGSGVKAARILLYVGIAVASLLVLGALFFFFRRQHRLAMQPAFHPAGMNPTGWNAPPVDVVSPVFDKPLPQCPNPRCGKEALVGQKVCASCGTQLNA
jgi:hypothetical protein